MERFLLSVLSLQLSIASCTAVFIEPSLFVCRNICISLSVTSLFVKCQILAPGNCSICAVCIWCLCVSVCASVCVGREAVWCESDPNPGWFLSHVCGTHPDGSTGLHKCHSDNETTGPVENTGSRAVVHALTHTNTNIREPERWGERQKSGVLDANTNKHNKTYKNHNVNNDHRVHSEVVLFSRAMWRKKW